MILTLSNGKEITLDKDEVFKDPKAAAREWLEQYNAPAIEVLDSAGIAATFRDGAVVTFTVNGLFPCTACRTAQCRHFHRALPCWTAWKWEMAERPDCSWGPTILEGIGIRPAYIVRPDLACGDGEYAPPREGVEIAPDVKMWNTIHGRLFHFLENGYKTVSLEGYPLSPTMRLPTGHVYVGEDHPDGHTDCLICRDGCSHVRRALELGSRL